jgi:cysteinyl-tRNA synthetase
MTHYRKKIKFSFENLDAARNGYNNLKSKIAEIKSDKNNKPDNEELVDKYRGEFFDCINDDLNVTEALAVLWDVLKTEDLNPADKLFLTEEFDKIFGLDLDKVEALEINVTIPPDIVELAKKRKEAKLNKDFKLADEYRNQIKEKGYDILDIKGGEYQIIKNKE